VLPEGPSTPCGDAVLVVVDLLRFLIVGTAVVVIGMA
jgi:hypothetical protein